MSRSLPPRCAQPPEPSWSVRQGPLDDAALRAAGAAVTALLVSFIFGPIIIDRLRHMALHQVVRQGTPDSHAGKGTTPTMGGLIILVATLLPTLLWMRLNNKYVWIALLVTLWMGGIGFLDDYLKLKRATSMGLRPRQKFFWQILLSVKLKNMSLIGF